MAAAIEGTSSIKKDNAAQRVRLLLNLIPEDPDFTHPLGKDITVILTYCYEFVVILDDSVFYGALVKHMKQLLKERDELNTETEWVLNEALNARHLQNGGTFQNVLSRRINEVVIPLFSVMIMYMDQYSNLSLLSDTK